MAKKKGGGGAKIDFKELGLKYGDRVGLAVCVLLAVLFIFWGFSNVSSSQLLTKEDVKKARDQSANHMRSFPVRDEALEPANSRPEVKTIAAISQLSESKKKDIPVGTLRTRHVFVYQPAKPDINRSKPDVLAVGKMIGGPIDMAYKLHEVTDKYVMIAESKDGIKLKKGQSGGNKLSGGGTGGMAGGPGRPGAKAPPTDADSASSGDSGKRWFPRMVPHADLKDDMPWAVNIWPARAAFVMAVFPYAKQIDELAAKLKMDRNEVNRESYFADLNIQRRELVLKGTRLADGTVVAQDMVLIPDPADPGKIIMKPYAEVPVSPADPAEAKAAGWLDLDMAMQATMTRHCTEFYVEPDGAVRGLILLGGRLNRKIPKPVRGSMPALQGDVAEAKALIEKIKKENTPIVQPKRDPRLQKDTDNQFEEDAVTTGPAGGGGQGSSAASGLSPSGPTIGTGSDKDKKNPADEKGKIEATQRLSTIPEFCLVRFLDLTLADERKPVGGRTFEYRVRVVMSNPNYGRRDVAVPEFAREKELVGPWGGTARVTFPETSYVFADERVRDPKRGNAPDIELDKVPVQVHKWIGFFDPDVDDQKDQERMGEWWVDRILAARGEYIGRVPTDKKQGKTKLIYWSAFTPIEDDPQRMGSDQMEEFTSPSLMTRSLLVDFQGGHKVQAKSLANKNYTEDIPAELLILEPDGRLIARSLLVDRDEETRKARFERWQSWFNTVKAMADRKLPKKDDKKDDKNKQQPGQDG